MYIPKRVYNTELYHHGILGQKWGIRRFQNPDGTLTAAGRKRYGKEINDIYGKVSAYDDPSESVYKKIGADLNKLSEAKEEIRQYSKKENDINQQTNEWIKEYQSKSKDDRKLYEAISETANFLSNRNDPSDFTMDDLRWSTYLGTYEDGQQSKINAYSMWADEKGIAKKASNLLQESKHTREQKLNSAKELVTDSLKKIGMNDVESIEISKKIVRNVENAISKQENVDDYAFYGLNSLADGNTFSNKDRASIKKAKSWCSNLDNNESTWWYIARAVEELNMGKIKCDDMTKADWNRINAKIREYRKTDGKFG